MLGRAPCGQRLSPVIRCAIELGPEAFEADDSANPIVAGRLRRNDCCQITDGAAGLVLVSDRLLKSYDTAGGADTDITPAILNRLGLTIDKVLEEYKSFIIERDDLDAIALQIAA